MSVLIRAGGGGKNTKDATAMPEDVKKGKIYYGKNGKQTGCGEPKATDYTGDATATPNDVLAGKTFYNATGKQIGTLNGSPIRKTTYIINKTGTHWSTSKVVYYHCIVYTGAHNEIDYEQDYQFDGWVSDAVFSLGGVNQLYAIGVNGVIYPFEDNNTKGMLFNMDINYWNGQPDCGDNVFLIKRENDLINLYVYRYKTQKAIDFYYV